MCLPLAGVTRVRGGHGGVRIGEALIVLGVICRKKCTYFRIVVVEHIVADYRGGAMTHVLAGREASA